MAEYEDCPVHFHPSLYQAVGRMEVDYGEDARGEHFDDDDGVVVVAAGAVDGEDDDFHLCLPQE